MLHYKVIERVKAEDRRDSRGAEARARYKTFVCLHGFLESISMWSVLRLEEYANLILIDLPGHGQSDLQHIDSMQSMAQAVQEVLDKEGVNSYGVIGHSMGGYVALELQEMDERCTKVILMNSNVWFDSEQKVEDRNRVAKLVQTKKERFVSEAIPNLFQAPENHPKEVKTLIQEASQISSEAIGRASIAMSQRRDFSEVVFSGELELIVVQGENDPIAPKERMEQLMVNQMENFHVVEAGHMAHLEAMKEVREVLKAAM
ncbi:MAG: alpha/beta hydrolase [bacterium]|nr:alpha/beta hydrolase [bacterium]